MNPINYLWKKKVLQNLHDTKILCFSTIMVHVITMDSPLIMNRNHLYIILYQPILQIVLFQNLKMDLVQDQENGDLLIHNINQMVIVTAVEPSNQSHGNLRPNQAIRTQWVNFWNTQEEDYDNMMLNDIQSTMFEHVLNIVYPLSFIPANHLVTGKLSSTTSAYWDCVGKRVQELLYKQGGRLRIFVSYIRDFFRAADRTCILNDAVVGDTGHSEATEEFMYYEHKNHTIDCQEKYTCENMMCVNISDVSRYAEAVFPISKLFHF